MSKKKVNIVLFGTGHVGSALIQQVLAAQRQLLNSEKLELNIPVIANSRLAFFQEDTQRASWKADLEQFGFPYVLEDVLSYVTRQGYENLVAVDATASDSFVERYHQLIEHGFHLVAANKVANTLSTTFYEGLRQKLHQHQKQFLYETNVGAGLPVIEALNNLHRAQEQITRVRGVISGSLSFIFNQFCANGELRFSQVLQQAFKGGLTEPDPRIDLSGKDVARKLLILGRELGLRQELEDVEVENLVPAALQQGSREQFLGELERLDPVFDKLRNDLQPGEVLRHVGELDLQSGKLQVKLSTEQADAAFGGLQAADSCFEIYTKSYGDRPIVIQGAGAGAAVTARGVLTDLIKLAEKIPDESYAQKM